MLPSLNDIQASHLNKEIGDFVLFSFELAKNIAIKGTSSTPEAERLEKLLDELHLKLNAQISQNPDLLLALALWNSRRPESDKLVETFTQIRNFIFFYCRPADNKQPWTRTRPAIEVSEKTMALHSILDQALPWGSDDLGKDGTWIPVAEWLDVAMAGRGFIQKFIEGPYQTWEDTEKLREPLYPIFLSRARELQKNPAYKALLQLKHTVEQF